MRFLVFDMSHDFQPIVKRDLEGSLNIIEDFYVKVGGQLYCRINICEDTPENVAFIEAKAKELRKLRDAQSENMRLALVHLGCMR